MKNKRVFCFLLTLIIVLTNAITVIAYDGISRDDEGNIFYIPQEQGKYSKGGYTIEKVSHPTLGTGEIDGILTGDEQDRGNSYSWSAVEYGDYVYIGTCYNSTYYIYHNNVMTTLKRMQNEGTISEDVDCDKAATDFVKLMFGDNTFDETDMNEWAPVIMAVNKKTGEAKRIFKERDVWAQYPNIFVGYSPLMATKNYLSGYRMAFEFKDKLYFAGMGNPTATLIEIDPKTNETNICYYNTNYTRGVSNGVHGLIVYDDEILMCLATDNYDGKGTPGGRIVASSNPSAGLDEWRVIADQDDFDGLPGVLTVDGLNGGGIWDIIEYNGYVYATIVTDKNIDGKINKQGFAMYRGEKQNDGSFTWTQVIGGNDGSKYGFGMGINHSMSCNMWVYDNHLYLGTYNDPMLDLAEVPASGDYELLYNDLDHSIYLYRMDENENFEQIGGKDDNPNFPEGPIGNLGAGLGNNSNQYVWRYGVHNDELYIGTFDTSTLTYQFTQFTDGQVAEMDYSELSKRSDALESLLLEILQIDDPYLVWVLNQTVFSDYVMDLYQQVSGFATDMSTDENPVPNYRKMQSDYEDFKEKIYSVLEGKLNDPNFISEYQAQSDIVMYTEYYSDSNNFIGGLKTRLKDKMDKIFETMDKVVYDDLLHDFVFYFGVNYYAQQSEKGFDLLVSKDGVNFDAITRDGFGDFSNHGLRVICPTEYGVFLGTANPYYGTQLWRLSSDEDLPIKDDEETLYTLSFETNGGTEVNSIEAKEGSKIDLSQYTTERDGYRFVGWYEDEGLNNLISTIKLTKDAIVYAKWEEVKEDGEENPGDENNQQNDNQEEVKPADKPETNPTVANNGEQNVEHVENNKSDKDYANVNKSPKTGDDSIMMLWISLMVASGGALLIQSAKKLKHN